MKKYRYIQDPGHGWVEVELQELERLGISGQVSRYSYANRGKVYLEEDCDAALFIQAKKAAAEPYTLVEVYQEKTPVRNYDSYRGQA